MKLNKVNKDKIENYFQKNENVKYIVKFVFEKNEIKLDSKKKYSIFASGIALKVLTGVGEITMYSPEEIGSSITGKSII